MVDTIESALRAAKMLIDNINEFGQVTDAEILDCADSAVRKALGINEDEPEQFSVAASVASLAKPGDEDARGALVPMGAIENGRAFADRLELTGLECPAGDLRMCSDWQEFRRCFDWLARWALERASLASAATANSQKPYAYAWRYAGEVTWHLTFEKPRATDHHDLEYHELFLGPTANEDVRGALAKAVAEAGALQARVSELVRVEHQTFMDAAQINAAAGSDAARDILAERRRQIEAEGWTPEHDDEHRHGEMADAAALYASLRVRHLTGLATWPWDAKWFKPTVGNHRRDLVKAGALILAEIERIDRARTLATPEVESRDA